MAIDHREKLLTNLRALRDRTLEDLKCNHPKNVVNALKWYAESLDRQIANIESFQLNTEDEPLVG